MQRKLKVSKFAEDLNFKFIHGQEMSNDTFVTEIGLSRVGLELAGVIESKWTQSKNILLGRKENIFLETLKKEKVTLVLDRVFAGGKIAVLILSKSFSFIDEIKTLAKKYKVVVVQSHLLTHQTILYVLPYINSKLWPREDFHSTLISVYGEGVLLTGTSGIGKSETALGLIKRGHFLIADDRVALYSSGIHLHGEPSNKVSRLLEIRGIGIIDVRYMYGHHIILPNCRVSLNINFVGINEKDVHIERIGKTVETLDFFHHSIPKINIQTTTGRNLMDLVETAVISYKLKNEGHNPMDHLNEYLTEVINKNSKENEGNNNLD